MDEITEIGENIFIMPDIDISNSIDSHFKGLYVKLNNDIVSEEFNDELFMVIKQQGKINIVKACSDRGITNVCTTAIDNFKLPVGLILGGFHLKDCTSEKYVQITHYFRILQPESIRVCHCSGIEKYAEIQRDCERHLFYNYTGNEVII